MKSRRDGSRLPVEVLVVDDEPGQRTTLCDLLQDAGFAAVSCTSAADALERAGRRVAAAAIVDLRMPDMNGLEVLKRLREIHGRMRVILHTGYGSFDSARDAINLGAYGFVEKMTDPKVLLDRVRAAVAEHEAQSAHDDEQGSLRSTAEQAPDILLQVERDGTIAFASRCFAGRTVVDLVGRSVFDLLARDHQASFAACLGAALDDERRAECEVAIEGTDGARFWYECRATGLTPPHGPTRAIVVARNVTQERQAKDVEDVVRPLLRNALEAIAVGGSLVLAVEPVELDEEYVSTHPDARLGPHLRVTVRDSGIGIAEDALEHIFEPFFTTKVDGEHAGLGLAHVYSVVARAGGHIAVESAPGEGATFQVFLPAANLRAPFPRAV
jgi:PAS domain S-box-containing protein